MESRIQDTIFMLKPDGYPNRKEIMEIVLGLGGLTVRLQKELILTKDQVSGLYTAHVEQPYFPYVVEYLTSGLVLVNMIRGIQAIPRIREVTGSTWPNKAAPGTIRALFGEKEPQPNGIAINVAHSTDAAENFPLEAFVLLGYVEINL